MRSILVAMAVQAISFAGLTPSLAANPAPPDRAAIAQACRADVERLCSGIQPGGGRIAACLRDKHERIGAPCRSALTNAGVRLP